MDLTANGQVKDLLVYPYKLQIKIMIHEHFLISVISMDYSGVGKD